MPARGANRTLALSDDDRRFLGQVRDSRTEEIRRVERARIILSGRRWTPSIPRACEFKSSWTTIRPILPRTRGPTWLPCRTHQVLRHIQVTSKAELVHRLELYLRELNEHPVRFRWTHFTPLSIVDNQAISEALY